MKAWTLTVGMALMAATALAGPANATGKTATCDRACLIRLTDAYVASFAKHSASGLPLAANVAVVENVKREKVGEGLWKDVTGGPTAFQVHVPDPHNQTAGWIGMVEREGKPTMVAVRLKLEGGRIVQAEHLYAAVQGPALNNLKTVRPGLAREVPAGARLSHDQLIRLGASYYDALDDNDGTKMPFAADCERHENGMVTAGPKAGAGPGGPTPHPVARDCAGQLSSGVFTYIDHIDDRRVFAADPQTGLVMGLSHFHHPMNFTSYPVKA